MIKFFRHIRKSLIEQNKMGKYFKYAIGEILLVVIGILIALQINNWNEDKKAHKIEVTYLESLRTEFTANLNALNTSISKCNRLVNQLDEILTFFEPKKLDTLKSEYIAKSLGNTLQYNVSFNPIRAVQTELISSGNLKQISNTELRQRIADFETYLDIISKQENNAKTINSDIGSQISRRVSFRPLFEAIGYNISGNSEFSNSNVKLLFKSFELENNFILYQAISKTTSSVYYSGLKEDINAILNIIEEELSPNAHR
ncbi:DUF6090 family protein [Winogradskyella sp.]|uniref:DUF6090 family protein n=1 Tax=Winogradskyella sp. TaxID=1883156 RepID=UPI0026050630|nr:DUF6090 family protein [Winogradskyella sp.]